jgi:hypothetical protein
MAMGSAGDYFVFQSGLQWIVACEGDAAGVPFLTFERALKAAQSAAQAQWILFETPSKVWVCQFHAGGGDAAVHIP